MLPLSLEEWEMLKGRKILVTGASGGIGRAIAYACAREGATVGIGFWTSVKEAETLHAEIVSSLGGSAKLIPFDVRDPEAVGEAIQSFVIEEAGIDGLVNCAGNFRPGLIVSLPLDEIEAQFAVNLLGPIHCTRAVLPTMIQQRHGIIINIGSVSAARPNRGQAVYAASKGAIESLTRALAVEYARKGVRVLCLQPGPIKTEMISGTRVFGESEILSRTPLRRLGTPDEVAELAVFLLSEKSSFITGSTYAIDGGYLTG